MKSLEYIEPIIQYMKQIIYPVFLFISTLTWAQKKPLDHTVYDQWQRIGDKLISPNGEWVVYTVEPQEGDGTRQ